MIKKVLILSLVFLIAAAGYSQKVTVSGKASDSTNGLFAIEIVINDTLSKIMKDPKNGRQAYLKIYQNPKYVVRTDSTGLFQIKANLKDSLYFKSYNHKTEAYLVSDLISRKQIAIRLNPERK